MENLPKVIVGFGGHGRVVAEALLAAGETVIAATDLSHAGTHTNSLGIKLIDDHTLISEYDPRSLLLVLGIGSISPCGKEAAKQKVVKSFTERGFRFSGVRHPFSWIASSSQSTIDLHVQVHAGAVIQPGVTIGEHSVVNTGACVDHDCQIGKFCHLAPGATLSGNVTVGDSSHLGTGCTVIQGIRIGAYSFVAAGATVVRDVEDGEWVRGTPARVFKRDPR